MIDTVSLLPFEWRDTEPPQWALQVDVVSWTLSPSFIGNLCPIAAHRGGPESGDMPWPSGTSSYPLSSVPTDTRGSTGRLTST